MTVRTPAAAVTRTEAEDFLYAEAALLDSWRLEEWAELLADDARYVVPSTDAPLSDTRTTLALVDDDIVRLRARVKRLLSPQAHRERPRPRTRRLVTNVRVVDRVGDATVVHANFVVYRIKRQETLAYMGRYVYHLVRASDGSLRILLRRTELDLESLRPHGTVSFIL